MASILGISAFYHDSAASLVVDGEIVAAAQEERFTRNKHDPNFPASAIAYCLEAGGLTPDRLDYVAFYEKPLVRLERLLETYLAYAPRGFRSFTRSMPVWLKKKLFMKRAVRASLGPACRAPLVFLEHHESHAASAFFPSPYTEAAILTIDGVGEWGTSTIGVGRGNRIELMQELQFPHSLGLLYSAFTYYCGFAVNSGEYKLMGLAPYGRPIYTDLILRHLVDLKADGSLWLNMQYFDYCHGLTMTGEAFERLFGGPARTPESPVDQRYLDLAASIQSVTEECMLRMGRHAHRITGMKNLVLGGGVALNCVGNGRLLREGPFEQVWIQPAAGDAGGSLGAALFVWHQLLERPRRTCGRDRQQASYLGPGYSHGEVLRVLETHAASYRAFKDEQRLLDSVADLLVAGKVVGWFRGRAEFGPRALGSRSILGDPRSTSMQATMNLKVKFRESFRPFAPVVLRDQVHRWFAMRPNEDSPYMLMVAPVLDARRRSLSEEQAVAMRSDPDLLRRVNIPRSAIPAVTHVDFSARVQTVDERHGRFHRLLTRFHEKTGCPVLVNTSFNLSWEPIVLTPEQAYRTFMQSEMDALVLEDCVLQKEDQPLGFAARSNGRPNAPSPWTDPMTGDSLVVTSCCARNPRTGHAFAVEDGIPRLFVPADLPGEDDGPLADDEPIDSVRALLERMRDRLVTRRLNEQIPFQARVLEVGCGTGQLTNYLSIAHRSVLGIDTRIGALRLANAFKRRHQLERADFAHMNPLHPALATDFFDVVITHDLAFQSRQGRLAFQRVGRLLRPRGHMIVLGDASDRRSVRTIELVRSWLDQEGFAFVNAAGEATPGEPLTEHEDLFRAHARGTTWSRMVTQLALSDRGCREVFVIGQKQ